MSDKLLGKVMLGAGFIFIGMLVSKVLNYLFRVVIARYLGPEYYGLFTLALAIVGVLVTIAMLGLTQGIVRYVAQYKGRNDVARINGVLHASFKITVPLSILFAVLLFIFAEPLALYFSKPKLIPLLEILALAIPLTVLITTLEKTILAFQKVQYNVVARSFVEAGLKFVLAFMLVFLGYGILWVSSAYIFSLFASVVVLFYFLHKKVHSLRKLVSEKVSVTKRLLRFSLPLLFTEVFTFLLVWTDTLLIGYYLISAEVGVYNAAVPTAMLAYIVPTTIRSMFYPVMSETYNVKESFSTLYKQVSDWIFFLTLPVAAYLILFSRQFLEIFFGKEYVSGYIVLIIICIAYLLYAFAATSHVMLYVLKKTKVVFYNSVIGVVMNVILNIILIPLYGIVGAAIATALSLIVRGLLVGGESLYYTKVFPASMRCVKAFAAVILVSVPAYLLSTLINDIISLVLGSLVFGLLYLGVLYILGFYRKEDKKICRDIIKKIPFL